MGAGGREGSWPELLQCLLASGVFLPCKPRVIPLLFHSHRQPTMVQNEQGKLCAGIEIGHPIVHLNWGLNLALENNWDWKEPSCPVPHSKQGQLQSGSRFEWSVSECRGCCTPDWWLWGPRAASATGRLLNDRNGMCLDSPLKNTC